MRLSLLIFISFLFLSPLVVYSQNDNDKLVVVRDIVISGNAKTKEYIITRELLVKKGDAVQRNDLNNLLVHSKENLFNTGLFNFITINIIEESASEITIFILLTERWYIFPYPILENADRNFSTFLHERSWYKINYGIHFVHYNFRGRAEKLKVKLRFGYKEQLQLYYEMPYLGKYKQHRFSAEFSWYRQHETSYGIEKDKLLYLRDKDTYLQKYHTSILKYQYRHRHYVTHSFQAKYSAVKLSDSVIVLNKNYLGNGINKTHFLSLGYQFNIDKRDYKFYPLIGYNLSVRLNQEGLGLLDDNFLKNTILYAELYNYLPITKRFFTGFGFMGQLSTTDKPAFFSQQVLGYKNYLRAYEYYVIDGQNYFTTRAFFKYAIIPMNIKYVQNWSWDKFNKIHYSLFVNMFFDSGYSYCADNNIANQLPNTYQYSFGIGLDLVTYYDFICRVEYSINRHLKHGVFINLGKAF